MKKVKVRSTDGDVVIDVQAQVRCRCGGLVSAGVEDTLERLPCVIHSVPACANFRKMEPPDFLAWIRMGDA